MEKKKIFKIIAGVVFMGLVVFFSPHSGGLLPLNQKAAADLAMIQIHQVPKQDSLQLVTEPDDGMAVAADTINSATKTIDLVIYELEDPDIEQLLVNAKERGVAVRVILQNVSGFGKHPNQLAYDFLQSHQVQVKWASKSFALTHQKTFIIDSTRALIMTFNLNTKYYSSSRDFALADSDPKDVAAIAGAFESDWNDSQITADNGSDLVWSPGSAATLLALINSSTKTLDVYNEEMADPRITLALEAAAKRGVHVRITMTYATNWKPAFNELVGTGVELKTYASSAKFYIHAKAIIADNQTAFIGSENFSMPSLDLNRELGILITKPEIISSVENTFAADFTAARPFESTTTTTANTNASTQTMIKLSKSGICHAPDSPSYNQTKNFTAYDNIEECLSAGGRLPATKK